MVCLAGQITTALGSEIDSDPGGQQEKELSCEEIAMMLDYAQKTDGKPLGIET